MYRLDPNVATRIRSRLQWLADNLDQLQQRKLKGDFAGLSKFRVGDYRVAYTFDSRGRVLLVHMVGHRRDIYDIFWDDLP